jgi:ParB-like chromosome segregation protein Spo0J
MESLETLRAWRQVAPTPIPVADIRTDDALQPRTPAVVPFRARHREEAQSAEHVATLRLWLQRVSDAELEPVLVADVDGARYLVDGHHRFRAYRAERRDAIPARVLPMTMDHAVLLSKLVNLDGAKLPLHREQARESAWQYLAAITRGGALRLPEGSSLRSVAGQFGIAHNTVRAMLDKLPSVVPGEWGSEAVDPGTGWPRWRYLRKPSAAADMAARLTLDQCLRRDAERVAQQLGKLHEKRGGDAFALGLRFYLAELKMHDNDTAELAALGDLADTLDGPTDF